MPSNKVIINDLHLKNFRIFKDYKTDLNDGCNLIIGKNGAGKTTILESASLLLPGKGLKRVSFADMTQIHNKCQENYWQNNYRLKSKIGIVDLEISYDSQTGSRKIFFNEQKIPSSDLTKFANMIWLTPQMDNLFLEAKSERRRFFDRIVFHFYPEHALYYTKYEYFMRERMKSLHRNVHPKIIEKFEEKMGFYGAKIAFQRVEIATKLQKMLEQMQLELPKIELLITGAIENQIQTENSNIEQIESFIKDNLHQNRENDKISGKTNFGVNKTNFTLLEIKREKQAKFCSTGEQKSMLIALIFAQILQAKNDQLFEPIILLDELFVHLDNNRINFLIEFLSSLSAQILITSCSKDGLESLLKNTQIINLEK